MEIDVGGPNFDHQAEGPQSRFEKKRIRVV